VTVRMEVLLSPLRWTASRTLDAVAKTGGWDVRDVKVFLNNLAIAAVLETEKDFLMHLGSVRTRR
jgi:hypothetical protein